MQMNYNFFFLTLRLESSEQLPPPTFMQCQNKNRMEQKRPQ